MNAPTQLADLAPPTREQLIDVLIGSIYPGAKRASAEMVLGYCEATGLDPLLKPVHIVPMSVKTGEKNGYGDDVYANRDVVMPGIGLYRTTAARTGQYAGQDEPVLGPMVELTFQQKVTEWVKHQGASKATPKDSWVDKTIRYPEWAQVTVYRLVGGFRCPFPAREYWLENYATASKYSDAPNAMWAKRTIGQLVKCAEAQALRKGFPEVGSQPTAEEMEGRAFEAETIDVEAVTVQQPTAPRRASEVAAAQAATPAAEQRQEPAAPVEPAANAVSAPAPAAAPAAPPAQQAAPAQPAAEPASEGQKKNVLITATAAGKSVADVLHKLGYPLDPATLEGLTTEQFKAIKAALR